MSEHDECEEREEQHFFERHPFHFLKKQLTHIERKLDKIMATQAEQTAKLNAIGDQIDKAQAEIVAAIKALTDAQANAGNTTPEEDAATARLQAAAQALDDINPDAPPPPTP